MHTLFQRVSTLLTVLLAVMMGMAAVTDVVSSYFLGEPVVKADLVGISYDRTLREPERGTPGVHILTDIDLDLTPLITWNTKLVFTYALVEYEHEKYGRQEHFIWDTSLYRRAVGPSAGKEIQPIVKNTFKGQRPFYILTDHLEGLSEKEFNIVIGWTVMPVVGRLHGGRKVFSSSASGGPFKFPKY